jgi:serine/threonine-protein kinase RsbW
MGKRERKDKFKKIRIKSNTRNLVRVREFIRKEAENFGFSRKDIEKIIMSVDEACTNSIKHSYRNQPYGDITVQVRTEGSKFIVTISDKGIPFNPDKIKIEPPYKKRGNYKKGGLGMFIMKTFMDDVKYEIKKGKNTVVLIKFNKQKHNR